jgi:hypothetical protein
MKSTIRFTSRGISLNEVFDWAISKDIFLIYNKTITHSLRHGAISGKLANTTALGIHGRTARVISCSEVVAASCDRVGPGRNPEVEARAGKVL